MKARQNFALPTVTSTYSGEAASGFIAAALLSANTLDKKYVTIMPNVKYKSVIQKLDVSGIIQDASCDFVTSGSVALSEQVLDSWEALSLGFSAFDEIPKNFNDFLISYVGGQVAEATEIAIWQGTNSNGSFPGFQTALSASVAAGGAGAVVSAKAEGGTTIISGSITASNVLAKLNDIVATIPTTVYGKQDLALFVPTNVVKAYQQALAGGAQGANGFNNMLNVGEKPLNFNGIEMFHCPGMGASKVVAAQKSNLFFGTGLLSDYNEVRVLDMANIDGSQNYRVIMRYTAGTQFGIGSDIVYYGAY